MGIIKEFLCVLCVFAVKTLFIDGHYLTVSVPGWWWIRIRRDNVFGAW